MDHYNVYRGTTPGLPVTFGYYYALGQPTTNSFSDTGLTASTKYYYKVSAVDTSGNISPLSIENSGTTASVNPIFYSVAIPGNGYGAMNSGGSVRYGEEANTASSLLIGKSLKTWKVRLRKRGTPQVMLQQK